MTQRFLAAVSLFVSTISFPAYATAAPAPAIVATSGVACVDTTVINVRPRQFVKDPFGKLVVPGYGFGVITFASYLGEENVVHDRPHATVAFADLPGDKVPAAERVGDRVRLCLLSEPVREGRCDPTRDWRGREYRVWDNRQHASYSGSNAEHVCGGA